MSIHEYTPYPVEPKEPVPLTGRDEQINLRMQELAESGPNHVFGIAVDAEPSDTGGRDA